MEKTDMLVKSPMALYVKLYCKKNARTRNRQLSLIEASKSWVSMSKVDRQYFMHVFKNYETKAKKYFASNLQNAQLYMKKKHHNKKRLRKGKPKQVAICPNHDDDQEINGFSPCHSDNDNNKTENQHELHNLSDCTVVIPEENGANVNFDGGHIEPPLARSITEPTPPIRTSMELFDILNSNGEKPNMNWSHLSKSQKNRYQRAVLSIKNNYLKEYITYLQELTPEMLFLHYKNKVLST